MQIHMINGDVGFYLPCCVTSLRFVFGLENNLIRGLLKMAGTQLLNNVSDSLTNKLDGGIHLNSYFSVQNCEDGSSSFSCGTSQGANAYLRSLRVHGRRHRVTCQSSRDYVLSVATQRIQMKQKF